jgi:glycosyltransferase involved in cell wall biosynthesis
MKLSVIIPCYNAARTLEAQLEALARQKFAGPWEVVLADNKSTDRSVAIAESFRRRLPRLRVISARARRGAAHARNCGARAARSDLLAFCDADDEVAPGYVAAMVEALAEHPFIGCRYEFHKLNQRWITACHTDCQASEIDRGLFGPHSYAGGGSLGVRKQAHEAIGGFDENLPALEDSDYCIRLQRAGFPLHFAPGPLVHVRWRSGVRAAFLQARNWGRGYIAVRQRHCPMQEPSDTLRSLFFHLLRIRRVRTSDQLAKWIWATGWQVGSIEGWRHQQKTPLVASRIVLP